MNGKGDDPRPLSISQNEFADRYYNTYGRKTKLVACWRTGCEKHMEVPAETRGAIFCSPECREQDAKTLSTGG